MPTRSGITPQIGTCSPFHQAIASSRSFVPSRAAQMRTPRGVLAGIISRVTSTRENSTPPARVGMTTASAAVVADCKSRSSPGGVSTIPRPSWRLIARVNVRSDGASTIVTPSTGRASGASAADACRSASISSTGSYPLATAAADRYTEVVVFPTPPLTFETTTFIQASHVKARSQLNEKRDVEALQEAGVEGEEVALEDARRLPARKLRPAGFESVRRRLDRVGCAPHGLDQSRAKRAAGGAGRRL